MLLRKDNGGTSLIELVIAMAIAAIILSMLMFFISGAANSFRIASDDVNLQMEAQTTINQLTNLAMEAETMTSHTNMADVRYIFRYSDTEYYAVVFNNSENILYLIKESTEDLANTAATVMNQHFMAEYVSSLVMDLSPNGKTVTINLELTLGQDSYQMSKKVKMRNA